MFHIIWPYQLKTVCSWTFKYPGWGYFCTILYHFVTGEFSSLTIIIITDVIDFVPLITFVLLIYHTFLCLFFFFWFFINYILMMICRVCKIVNTIVCKKTLHDCKDVNLPDCSLLPFFLCIGLEVTCPISIFSWLFFEF